MISSSMVVVLLLVSVWCPISVSGMGFGADEFFGDKTVLKKFREEVEAALPNFYDLSSAEQKQKVVELAAKKGDEFKKKAEEALAKVGPAMAQMLKGEFEKQAAGKSAETVAATKAYIEILTDEKLTPKQKTENIKAKVAALQAKVKEELHVDLLQKDEKKALSDAQTMGNALNFLDPGDFRLPICELAKAQKDQRLIEILTCKNQQGFNP